MDNKMVEKIHLEDGRLAERHVVEVGNERVVELYSEEPRPLKLEQKIIERTKPVVYEREWQKVDQATGNVVEQKLETLEPNVNLSLREHLGVEAQSIGSSNYATKDDLITAVKSLVSVMQNQEVHIPVQAQSMSNPKMNGLSMLEERVSDQESPWMKYGLIGILFVQFAFLGYAIFVM